MCLSRVRIAQENARNPLIREMHPAESGSFSTVAWTFICNENIHSFFYMGVMHSSLIKVQTWWKSF